MDPAKITAYRDRIAVLLKDIDAQLEVKKDAMEKLRGGFTEQGKARFSKAQEDHNFTLDVKDKINAVVKAIFECGELAADKNYDNYLDHGMDSAIEIVELYYQLLTHPDKVSDLSGMLEKSNNLLKQLSDDMSPNNLGKHLGVAHRAVSCLAGLGFAVAGLAIFVIGCAISILSTATPLASSTIDTTMEAFKTSYTSFKETVTANRVPLEWEILDTEIGHIHKEFETKQAKDEQLAQQSKKLEIHGIFNTKGITKESPPSPGFTPKAS